MRKIALFLSTFAALSLLGCSKDEGTVETLKLPSAEETQKNMQKQIDDVNKNPNIPPAQKQMIIQNIQMGAARQSTGSEAGKSQGQKK